MRARWFLLLVFVSAACVKNHPRTLDDMRCALSDQGVYVTRRDASWVQSLSREQASNIAFLSLRYEINLDPDEYADQRRYDGLADRPNLTISIRGPLLDRTVTGQYLAQVRTPRLTITRMLNGDGWARFEGSDLDTILGADSDLDIVVFSPASEILRHRVTRETLREIDGRIRSMSTQLQERLRDPEHLCASPEEILVTEIMRETV